MILKIRAVGEPVLRQPAKPLALKELLLAQTQELIAAMRETMHDAPGVGLAAPQIGQALQLVVIEDRESYMKDLTPEQLAQRERKPIPFHVIVNPVLTLESEPVLEFFEGCLSLPGFTAVVPRARQVKVKCWNEHGEPQTIHATGWYARILQHEVDHLFATLYVDRMQSATLSSLENFKRYYANGGVRL